jgi:hypothetical protein
MRRSTQLVDQETYAGLQKYVFDEMGKRLSADKDFQAQLMKAYPKTLGGEIDPKDWDLSHPLVAEAGRRLIKTQWDVLQKAGVSTSLGFNFFDLRGPAYFIFPLLTPFIQMIGRAGRVNAGVGTAAHWKATRNPNSTNIYAGVEEGKRNAQATPDEIDYLATYKELGEEGGITFTAQWAGEGYTDNLADEHFRNLARLRLQEEMLLLNGNSGTAAGNNGYALGTTPTPTATLATGTGALGTGSNVFVACVAITPMGMNPGGQGGYNAPPTVAGGLTTNQTRTNIDGTTTAVVGGLAAISAISTPVATTNAAAQFVNAAVAAVKGAVGYAWFWGVNVASSLANLKLGAITSVPNFQITNVAAGTQLGNAAGLGTDNSFQPTDFDGLLTYAFKNGLWTDMGGGTLTPQGNGQVKEIEADLKFLWDNYQAQPDGIWCSSDSRLALDQAVIFSSTGNNSYIFQYTRDSQGGILGGFLVTAYKSKYSINAEGGAAIPIRLHPMIPAGCIWYDINKNPYPHSRIPAVRQILTQRDYYAIEWPVVSRNWTFGTYVQEVLAHYMPWVTAIRTGVGPFVAPCWIAAVVFGESFEFGPRVALVRKWLVNDWEKSGPAAKLVMGLYRKYGERAAKVVEKSRLLKACFLRLFNKALEKAEAKYGKAVA